MKKTILSSVFAMGLLCVAAGPALAASLPSIIEDAEQTFGGEAFDAETYLRRSEVDVLSGNEIIEAVYDAETGELIFSEVYGSRRLVERVAAALDQAVLSLLDAIEVAEDAVGPGEILEAALSISRRRSGKIFVVDIRTDGGVFDVFVDSATGEIVRVIRD